MATDPRSEPAPLQRPSWKPKAKASLAVMPTGTPCPIRQGHYGLGKGWDTKSSKAAQRPAGDTHHERYPRHPAGENWGEPGGHRSAESVQPGPVDTSLLFWSWPGTDPSGRAPHEDISLSNPWARWGALSLAKPPSPLLGWVHQGGLTPSSPTAANQQHFKV